VYAADVVFVTSAGNTARPINEDVLKVLGGRLTPMIVAGGVYNTNNSVWPVSSFGDELTVYAQSVGTQCAFNTSDAAVGTVDGTSQAAGTVSGLAAYFLSHPAYASQLLVPGEVSIRVKNFIWATSAARVLPAPAARLIACNGELLTDEERTNRDEYFLTLMTGGVA
jgi:hypothetical protein